MVDIMKGSTPTTLPSVQEHTSESQENLQIAQKAADYDPCANATPCSPFYLYNHDSPRPSTDGTKFKQVNISVHDLELGETISPSVTQEKLTAQKTKQSKFRLWKRRQPLRTTPKKKGRIARLPKKQQMIVKGIIAFLVIGTMIGIAVGIAAGLKSGVWRGANKQSQIN